MDSSFLAAADNLDKLLDEFEENEEVSPDFRITSHAVKKSPFVSTPEIATHNMNGNSNSMHSGQGGGTGQRSDLTAHNNGIATSSVAPTHLSNNSYPREKSDTINSTDSDFLLDLSEADFAPSPQSLPPNLASLPLNLESLPPNLASVPPHLSSLPSLQTNQHGGVSLDLQRSPDPSPVHLQKSVEDGSSSSTVNKGEHRQYFRGDSNSRLGDQDFSSYLPTNSHNTLSFGDLKFMNAGSLAAKETRYPAPSSQTNNTVASESAVSHDIAGPTLTQTQSSEEVRQSEVVNYISSGQSTSEQQQVYGSLYQSTSRPQSYNSESPIGSTSTDNLLYSVNTVSENDNTSQQSINVLGPVDSQTTAHVNTDNTVAETTGDVDVHQQPELIDSPQSVAEHSKQTPVVDCARTSLESLDGSAVVNSNEDVQTDPQDLDNSVDDSTLAGSSVTTSLPDPKLMDAYVRQGARPKTVIPGTSPKHSPLKGTVNDEESSPKKVMPKIVQLDPSSPVSHPKPVVGFHSIEGITVTDADLDALDDEVNSSVPNMSADLPNQAPTGQLSVSETMEDSRVSPISKILNRSQQEMPDSSGSNELTGMDPFYNATQPKQEMGINSGEETGNVVTQPSSMIVNGVGINGSSSVGDPTQGLPVKSSISNGLYESSDGPDNDKDSFRSLDHLNNSTVPKQSTNANVTPQSQLNNSNSQIGVQPKRQQVDSLLDMSNTALQGLTLAMNAANVETAAPTGNNKGSPQHSQGSPQHIQNLTQEGNHQQHQSPMSKVQNIATMNQQQPGQMTPGYDVTNATSSLSSPNRTHSAQPPSAFQLPPPKDPPTYQQVTDATRREDHQHPKPGVSRQGLTLNFAEQPPPRKTGVQPIPPSTVVEGSTPETNASPEGVQNNVPGGIPIDSTVPSQVASPPDNRMDLPNGQVPQSSLLLPPGGPPNSLQQQQNADGESRTSSNETDSDMEGDFPPGLVPELSEELVQLGNVAPVWLPDSGAITCMMCSVKFTFRKRRHHCRACGKIFCSKCCSTRIKLKYMDSKEARVCVSCLNAILRAQSLQRQQLPPGAPDPRNPSEYCSTVPPTQQASQMAVNNSEAAGADPPSVMVPVNKSSLRRPGSEGSNARPRETRHVRFSDGIHPGGIDQEFMVEENPNVEQLLADLKSDDSCNPVVFVLNNNLLVMVKIVNLNCCVNRTCWCFATKGMATAGQDEIVIVLECLPDEKMLPRDIFTHLQTVYDEASKGNTVSHMSHSICKQGFLGSKDHGGFLYLSPTFQCLRQLVVPESPYLFAVLLQKWETPWAKVFPLRLLLRLGAEFRYYPCPLMSVRFRKPVFGEIGHTIMNLLADFKNYQYLLPVIPGVTILMKDRETHINFPKNRYDDVMKVLNNSNEHVMALAANFSSEADSHLVCIQNDDGSYQTQAINIQNKPRKVTGASFVVFNGALKSSTGLTAKSSIVEDGLMVQIRPDMMTSLRQAMREMQDFVIPCKSVTVEQVEETVCVKWVEDDNKFNIGVTSPIDGRTMEGIESVRIHNGTDFRGKSRSLRWTEVFFLENNEPVGRHHEPVDLSKLAESLSMSFSVALANHLDELREMGLAKLGLRVTIDTERVGYEAGAKSQQLPPVYMNELDNELIPVLHNAVSHHEGGPVVLELIFHIIE